MRLRRGIVMRATRRQQLPEGSPLQKQGDPPPPGGGFLHHNKTRAPDLHHKKKWDHFAPLFRLGIEAGLLAGMR